MENLLTVNDVAGKLRKSRSRIYFYINSGIIPNDLLIRLGNKNGSRPSIRMRESDLEKLVESCRGK